jgi:hypothetical protein
MITGYYIRQNGDRCQLIRQDEQYRDEVVLDGLPYDRAAKLYWRFMREWLRERARQERQPEPTLFELTEDARPTSQKKAAGRLAEPTLFEL